MKKVILLSSLLTITSLLSCQDGNFSKVDEQKTETSTTKENNDVEEKKNQNTETTKEEEKKEEKKEETTDVKDVVPTKIEIKSGGELNNEISADGSISFEFKLNQDFSKLKNPNDYNFKYAIYDKDAKDIYTSRISLIGFWKQSGSHNELFTFAPKTDFSGFATKIPAGNYILEVSSKDLVLKINIIVTKTEEQETDPVIPVDDDDSQDTPTHEITPLYENELKQDEKPVLNSSDKVEVENDGFVEVKYDTFQANTKFICDSYIYGIRWEGREIEYYSANVTLDGIVRIDEEDQKGVLKEKHVTGGYYYLKAGDVYKQNLETYTGDNSFYPDVFRYVNVNNADDWKKEEERVEKANNSASAAKIIYHLINTRAKNIENKDDSLYFVAYPNVKKEYKFYIGESKYKFEYTCSQGKVVYEFNELGRVTSFKAISNNSSTYENFECKIEYSKDNLR